MVKSYQGVRVVDDKKNCNQPMCVKDYMATNLVTFKPDDSIEHVLQILTSKKISGGPVVDENGKMIGMISEGDCLKEISKGKYSNTPSLAGKVKEHMTTDVMTMDPDLNIFDAAGQFLNLKIRRFPVMSYGNLVGQISISDITKGIQKMKSTTW